MARGHPHASATALPRLYLVSNPANNCAEPLTGAAVEPPLLSVLQPPGPHPTAYTDQAPPFPRKVVFDGTEQKVLFAQDTLSDPAAEPFRDKYTLIVTVPRLQPTVFPVQYA